MRIEDASAEWKNDVLARCNSVTTNHDLQFNPTTATSLGIDLRSLPYSRIIPIIPHFTHAVKFAYQAASFQLKPGLNGFSGITDLDWHRNNDQLTFSSPPCDGPDLSTKWHSWFAKKFVGTIGKVDGGLSDKVRANKLILFAAMPDELKIAICCGMVEPVDKNRISTPVILLNFDSTEAMKDFQEAIEVQGSNALNATFAVMLSREVTTELNNISRSFPSTSRENYFCAIPTTKILVEETNLKF